MNTIKGVQENGHRVAEGMDKEIRDEKSLIDSLQISVFSASLWQTFSF
jgi:hypothetical protein